MLKRVLFQLTECNNNINNNLVTQKKKIEECLIENKKVLDEKLLLEVSSKSSLPLII
jgi:chaperonin cofactor prefoldin